MSTLLKEGDVIVLDERHKVYAKREIPTHGGGKYLTSTETPLHNYPEYKGEYMVVKTAMEGGGYGHGFHDVYPDGHHVYCERISDGMKVDFYQTGCFTATISNIQPIRSYRKVVTTKWIPE